MLQQQLHNVDINREKKSHLPAGFVEKAWSEKLLRKLRTCKVFLSSSRSGQVDLTFRVDHTFRATSAPDCNTWKTVHKFLAFHILFWGTEWRKLNLPDLLGHKRSTNASHRAHSCTGVLATVTSTSAGSLKQSLSSLKENSKMPVVTVDMESPARHGFAPPHTHTHKIFLYL